MKAVVDTNVPVVANGRSPQASGECARTCAVRLNELTKRGKIVLDDDWLILKEYVRNLDQSGQPGPGDAFLKWVLLNHANPNRCEKVRLTPTDASKTNFAEFPQSLELQRFDPSDRKFVAVALGHPDKPPVLQATDAQWWDLRDHMKEAGVTIDFLCPNDIKRISSRRDP